MHLQQLCCLYYGIWTQDTIFDFSRITAIPMNIQNTISMDLSMWISPGYHLNEVHDVLAGDGR